MQAWSERIGLGDWGLYSLYARVRMFVHLHQDLERLRCWLGLRG